MKGALPRAPKVIPNILARIRKSHEMCKTSQRFLATPPRKSPLLLDRKCHVRQPSQSPACPCSVCESKGLEQGWINLIPCEYCRHRLEDARVGRLGRNDEGDQLLGPPKRARHPRIPSDK